jgi:hypothetical protein
MVDGVGNRGPFGVATVREMSTAAFLQNQQSAASGQLTSERLLAVYRAAAVDEGAADEVTAILARCRSLLETVASIRFDDTGGNETDDGASAEAHSAYAQLRTSEIDLHVSLLKLAKENLKNGAWRTAATQAAAVSCSGLLRLDASRILADALGAGLVEVVKNGHRADLDAWLTDARRLMVSEAEAPDVFDEVLLAGVDAALAESETGPRYQSVPSRLDLGVAIAEAYVGLDAASATRQKQVGQRLAGSLKTRGPGTWMLHLLPHLSLRGEETRMDQLAAAVQRLGSLERTEPTPYDQQYKTTETGYGGFPLERFDHTRYQSARASWERNVDLAEEQIASLNRPGNPGDSRNWNQAACASSSWR